MGKHRTAALPPLPASLAGFTALELNQKVPLAKAAGINGFKDPETFRKNFPHLVKRIGRRKLGVSLYDAIMLPPPDQD